MGSFPSHIDFILPELLILEAKTHKGLEWNAALEIKPSGFQTGVRRSSSGTGSLRTLAGEPAFSPLLTSVQGTQLLSAPCHGVMFFFFFFFFRKEGFLSVLVMVGSPDQMAVPLSFSVTG